MPASHTIDYHDGDTLLEGYISYPDKTKSTLPAVLIAHDWSGKNHFACQKADEIASLGYIGFALDMYGKGIIGQTKEEKSALISPFMENRFMLKKRMEAALATLKLAEGVDTHQIASIGFCFGGLCALDLARSGADIKGVVSFHGLLHAPQESFSQTIRAKILALHGYDDPMVTPDHVMAFADEMTRAHADWQLHLYGNTMHAFTNPEANDPAFGTMYHPTAHHRAWIAMQDFFRETFKSRG